jgi:hypothetical protein
MVVIRYLVDEALPEQTALVQLLLLVKQAVAVPGLVDIQAHLLLLAAVLVDIVKN